jgi:hypothetical protein
MEQADGGLEGLEIAVSLPRQVDHSSSYLGCDLPVLTGTKRVSADDASELPGCRGGGGPDHNA